MNVFLTHTNMIIKKDDNFLLYEIKKGNEQAFRKLFTRYYCRLINFASRFTNDSMIAEDLVQDSFVNLWEKRDKLECGSLSSLLFTMVRNNCLNHLKHQALINISNVNWLENLDGEERLYNQDFCPDVEMSLLYKELLAQIPIVLSSLPERSRKIFLMSRKHGLKNREIAEKLSISTTAVEKHIRRVLDAFETHFKEKYPIDTYQYIIILLALIS